MFSTLSCGVSLLQEVTPIIIKSDKIPNSFLVFLAPAQHNPFAAAQSERLLGAHRDQVAFDFGHQPECETEHLAVG